MADEIPTIEPEKIISGMTVKWKKTLDDYPAPAWTLTYVLFKLGSQINFNAVPDGTDHSVVLTKSDTAGYDAGEYHWQAYVDDATERYQVGEGTLEIITDFSQQTTGHDLRSNAQIMYEGIMALLEGKIGRKDLDVISYGISAAVGRNITKMPIADLRKEMMFYKQQWDSEKSAEQVSKGLGTGKKISVRFISK